MRIGQARPTATVSPLTSMTDAGGSFAGIHGAFVKDFNVKAVNTTLSQAKGDIYRLLETSQRASRIEIPISVQIRLE